jgi:hypothetical protein
MLWKEFRANARWAVLAMLLLGAGMVYGVRQIVLSPAYVSTNDGLSLTDSDFAPITVFGSGLAAIFLGTMQTLPERRPDAWAFLVHRPVSRSWLFATKAMSGLALYLAAALLPLLGAAIWVAVPGHLPIPFDWRLALPRLADILAGISYYFAGMLIGVRSARWYGSRLLVLGTPVLTSLFVILSSEFWQALLWISLGSAITATAAWGSFVTVASPRRQPRVARLALGFSIYCGIYVVGVIVYWIAEIVLFTDHTDVISAYYILPNGDVIRGDIIRGTMEDEQLSISDPAGKPIDKYKGATYQTFNALRGNVPEVSISLNRQEPWPAAPTQSYRGSTRCFSLVYNPGGGYGDEIWYYVYPDRELTGYAVKSASRIGVIGPNGFAAGQGGPGHRFEAQTILSSSNWNWSVLGLVVSPSTAYDPLVEERRVQAVFQAPGGQVLQDAAITSLIYQASNGQPDRRFIAAATDKAIYISPIAMAVGTGSGRGSAGAVLSVPFAHDPKRYDRASISAIADGGYVIRYSPSASTLGKEPGSPDYAQRISAAGQPTTELELPQIQIMGRENPLLTLLVFGAPPAGLLASLTWYQVTHPSSVRESISAPWSQLFISILYVISIVVYACIAYRLTRRYAFTRAGRIRGTIAVSLLGPAALLTLFATHSWPARERCPSCGRKRVVTQATCEHCKAGFPPPAADGTEIVVCAGGG